MFVERFVRVGWLICVFLMLAFLAPHAAAAARERPKAVFSHLEQNADAWLIVKVKPGKTFDVVIQKTAADEFHWEMAGVLLTPTPDSVRDASSTAIPEKDLKDHVITYRHEKQYGGYVLRARQKLTGHPKVKRKDNSIVTLREIELHIAVVNMAWDLDFAGAFTVSKLTNPVFAVVPAEDGSGDIVVRDESKEDEVALGLGAFIHLYHKRAPYLAFTFGLGISNQSEMSFFFGPSYRFSDKGAVTVGYTFGSVTALPAGQEVGEPPKGENVLNNLKTHTEGAFFVAVSFTFINVRGQFEGPFAGDVK